MPNYWLLKSEPDCSRSTIFSAMAIPAGRRQELPGAELYARRDEAGGRIISYHSGAEPPCVAGIAEVAREGYDDHTALDPDDDHFDSKATPENGIWSMVDVRFVRKFAEPVPLAVLKATPGLERMVVTQRGSQL